jgi:hypothetical protein
LIQQELLVLSRWPLFRTDPLPRKGVFRTFGVPRGISECRLLLDDTCDLGDGERYPVIRWFERCEAYNELRARLRVPTIDTQLHWDQRADHHVVLTSQRLVHGIAENPLLWKARWAHPSLCTASTGYTCEAAQVDRRTSSPSNNGSSKCLLVKS